MRQAHETTCVARITGTVQSRQTRRQDADW